MLPHWRMGRFNGLAAGLGLLMLLQPFGGAEPIFRMDGSGSLPGQLTGTATHTAGAVHLTEAVTSQGGSWIFDPGAVLPEFSMRCRLFIGGGSGADGMSFSYGEIADGAVFGETGASGNGISVGIVTYTHNYIALKHNGVTVASTSLSSGDLRTNTWAQFRVAVSLSGAAQVWYANALVIETQLSGWNPQPGWRCGFGGRTGGANDKQYVDEVVIETPSPSKFLLSSGYDGIDVSQHTSSGLLWTGDINGDGDVDLVRPLRARDMNTQVADWTAIWEIDVFLSDGAGSFVKETTTVDSYAFPANGHMEQFTGNDALSALELGDLDGDGDLDIVYGTAIYGVRWIENLGGGESWGTPLAVYAPDSPYSFPNVRDISLGDVDQDGRVDVAVSLGEQDGGRYEDRDDKGAYVLLFNGGSGLTWTTVFVQQWVVDPGNIEVVDLQGDGYLEVLMGGWTLAWAVNSGGRSFSVQQLAQTYPSGGVPSSIRKPLAVAADIDGDGAKDIVSSWPQQDDFTNKHLLWLPNAWNGAKSFSWDNFKLFSYEKVHSDGGTQWVETVNLTGNYLSIEAVDLTLNGIADLLCYETGGYEGVDCVLNDGSAMCSLKQFGTTASVSGTCPQASAGLSVSSGSWDRFPDIFVTNVKSGTESMISRVDNQSGSLYQPVISSVEAVSGRTMEVSFSQGVNEAGLLAGNYSVSGAGQGTLSTAPDSVSEDGGVYTLTWTEGLMGGGSEIRVTVSGAVVGAYFDAPFSDGSATATTPAPPGLSKAEVLDARNIKVTYTTHMNDAVMTNTVYSISGPGQGSLSAHPDRVTKISDTVYQLTWNTGSMFNKGAITVAVNGDLLYSVDFIEFSSQRTADSVGIAQSPLVEVGDPNPGIVNSGAPVQFYVQYYVPNMPDAVIAISLSAEDVLFVPSDSLPGSYTESKGAKSIPTDEIGVSVEADPSNGDRRIVTLTNLKGDGSLGILLSDSTAHDDAGNPVAHMDQHSAMVVVDNTAPTLTLAHACPLEVQQYTSNFDLLVDDAGNPRVTASDVLVNETRDITGSIVATPGAVSTETVGSTGVVYSVVDSAGNVANPVTCDVVVAAAEVKLTMVEADGGSTSPPPGAFGYSIGGAVDLRASADRCHEFDHWDIGGSSVAQNPYSLTLEADVVVTPVFSEVDCRPGVEMVWPNGAEKWPMGQTVQVMWKSYSHSDADPRASLSVIDTARGNRATIIDSAAPDAAHAIYEWVVPETFVPSSSAVYKMKVSWSQDGATVDDQSDNPFVLDYVHDDVSYYAASVAVGGAGVADRFDYSGDEDWFYFSATAGVSYQVETVDLGDNCDTKIEIYNNDVGYPADPSTALASNEDAGDGSYRSLLTWTAPESHLYYVRVLFGSSSSFQYDFGPGTEFSVQASVAGKAEQVHVPPVTIAGVVYDALTMLPIHRAEVVFPDLGGLTFFADEEGVFRAENLPSFAHLIEAESEGYYPMVRTLLAPPGSTRELELLLIPIDAGEGEGEGEVVEYLSVTTQAGAGGVVFPSGSVIVPKGDVFSVSVSADACYEIEDVLVDGVSVGAVSAYTFVSVSGHHRLEALFAPVIGEVEAVASLEASQGSFYDRIRLLWRMPRNAVEYQIWRDTERAFTHSELVCDWTPANWFDDTAVYLPETGGDGCVPLYYYRVIARDACGNKSPLSAVVSGYVTPPENPVLSEGAPPAPVFVQASDGVFTAYVQVVWSPVAGASGYFVYRGRKADASDAQEIARVSEGVSWRDYDVVSWEPDAAGGCRHTGPEQYYYYVASMNNCGLSGGSEIDSGYAGEMASAYEEALPSRYLEDGTRIAGPAEVLAVRLRTEGGGAIDAASVWGRVSDGAQTFDAVSWVEQTPSDGWVVFAPESAWSVGAIVQFEAGAQLSDGSDLPGVSFTYEICAANEKAWSVFIDGPEIADPDGLEAIGVAPAEAACLEGCVGGAWWAGADQPFEGIRRAWLPLPAGYEAEALILCVLVSQGGEARWREADSVAGLLDGERALLGEAGGRCYYGAALHYGATLAFVERAAAPRTASVGGSEAGHWLLVALLMGSFFLARRRVVARRSRHS